VVHQSRSSRDNPYRDWYMWHDGKGETATDKGEPPNNWQSDFGHSAWEWDEKTRQYYYHKFYIQQPDVNWDNPKIHEAFKDIVGFWLKRGVGGFRFDAITTLFEDPQLRDEDMRARQGRQVVPERLRRHRPQRHAHQQPARHSPGDAGDARLERHVQLQQVSRRARADRRNVSAQHCRAAKQYGTPDKPEFQLPMDTQVGFINKLDVAQFRAKLNDVETEINGNIPLLVFDNHDNPRLDAAMATASTTPTLSASSRPCCSPAAGGAVLLRRRDRHEDHAAHAQGRCERPRRPDRLAQGQGPRRRAHADAVELRPQCRIHQGRRHSLAARPADRRTVNVKAEEGDPDSLLHLVPDPDPPEEDQPRLCPRRQRDARHREHQGAELDAANCGRAVVSSRSTSPPTRRR
jgi:hypothetical protein